MAEKLAGSEWLAIGVGLGLIFGTVMDNIALGLALGLAFGLIFSQSNGQAEAVNKTDPTDESEA